MALTNAEAELLAAAIADLLQRIPDTWTEYHPDDLGDAADIGLSLLVAAGMVERRIRLRMRMANDPALVEATVTFTGEFGGPEACERLSAVMWGKWAAAWRAWQAGDARAASPFQCERLPPEQWRLTDQGTLARQDLHDREGATVFDFVLKRGFFDGRPRLVDRRTIQRHPVRGQGRLERVVGAADNTSPSTVTVANWDEGGKALAAALTAALNGQGGVPQASGEVGTPPGGQPAVTAAMASAPAAAAGTAAEFRHSPWPGSNQWANWGLGPATDGTWHLFHFNRTSGGWIRHCHATLAIPTGIAEGLARKFVRFGFVGVADAHEVLSKHAKGGVREQIHSMEVVSKVKAPMSRLRSAIRQAVKGEGHTPRGMPIGAPTRRAANWQARIKFGTVERRSGGGYLFRVHY